MSDKSERIFQSLSDISDQKVDEAARRPAGKRPVPRWRRWTALAACLCLVAGAAVWYLPRMGGSSSNNGLGGSGVDGVTNFMSYAGPVFPLTLAEENGAVTAQREITLDFQPWVPRWISNEEMAAEEAAWGEESYDKILSDLRESFPDGGYSSRSTDLLIRDRYVLTNHSDQEQRVQVLYPFVSSLRDLTKRMPTLSADGEELETVLHPGGYSGGFQDTEGQTDGERLNLRGLDSWEAYRDLLSDGSYLEGALGDYPDLTGVPVTVYRFTDPWGPEQDEKADLPNPTLRVEFELDYDRTTVLSYGFHGGFYDREAGIMGQSFSIPQEWERDHDRPYYLIVLGDDVANMTTQGYNTGGWDTDKKIEAGVDIQRYESNLDTALRDAAALLYETDMERWSEDLWGLRHPAQATVDFEMYYGLLCGYLMSYGLLSEDPAERYETGWLEEVDFEVADRVCYLEGEVTIPAGGTVEVTAQLVKNASFDFYCAHTENEGVYGYDLVTRLGSALTFTGQSAVLEDREQIKIVRQNFGFEPESGIRTVELNPEEEHYYLAVRRVETEE